MPVTDKKAPILSDYVVLLFIGAILAIDFLPYFETMEIINPQFLYLSVINILMGVYFYFSPKSIAIEGFSILKKSYLVWLYLAFLILCSLSVFVANNISLVFTDITQIAIVFLLVVNLTILLKDKMAIFYRIAFLVCISAFLQSFQELYNFILTSNRSSIFEALNQMKGNTGNINILAASLSIKLPFLLLGITYFKGNKKWFAFFTLLLVSTAIILTGARTALIDLFLVVFIYIFYHLKINSFNKSAFIKISVLIIPVVLSVLTANMVFNKSKVNDERYSSVASRIEQINSNDASAQKRLMMWENALELTKTHPFLGVGLGNYRIESIPYEKTSQDDHELSLHTHNDFLEIMSETGIINGIIYVSLFVFIFFINLKRIIKSKDENARIIALTALLLVIIYGVDSLFNFPMYRPTMQIFLALLFAFTLVNNSVLKEKLSDLKDDSNFNNLAIVFSAITCFSAFLLFKASNLEYLIKTDDINSKASGVLTGDEVINRLPLFPNVFGTSESFYEYAGIYYFREKNYKKSLDCFDKANKINPYLGRVDFYKHLVFEEMGNADSAYAAIKKTFYIRPRNYPFYQRSINTAAKTQDTVEILKEHKIFTKYRNFPDAWKQTAYALQISGYNRKNLLRFVDEGLRQLPNDSLLLRQKKDFMVTDFIIEGQKYASEGNLPKTYESYNKALKIDPGNVFATQNIGFYYFNLGQYNKAISYFLNALKSPGLYDGQTEYYIGISYLNTKDPVNACKYFNLAKTKNYAGAQQQIDQNCK